MGQLAAGDLTQRVTLITPGEPVEDEGLGGYMPGPTVEQAYWAKVVPVSGGELLTLGQVANTNAYKITLRKQPGAEYTPKQRVRWNGGTLNVQRVVTDFQQREYVILTCFNSGK